MRPLRARRADCFALSWQQKPAELVPSCGLCSSFMNINEDARRPTELIKTQNRYYSPTVGRLPFLVPSSRKSAIPGSQSSSFLTYLLLHTGRVVAKSQITIQQAPSSSSHRLTTRIRFCLLRISYCITGSLCPQNWWSHYYETNKKKMKDHSGFSSPSE